MDKLDSTLTEDQLQSWTEALSFEVVAVINGVRIPKQSMIASSLNVATQLTKLVRLAKKFLNGKMKVSITDDDFQTKLAQTFHDIVYREIPDLRFKAKIRKNASFPSILQIFPNR